MERYIDREIASKGVLEPTTTNLLRQLLKPGMHLMDIGANLGYFTLLSAQQIGPAGKVWAFEPVNCYREQLQWHIATNHFEDRVKILPYGLADTRAKMSMAVDNISATLHWTLALTSPTVFEEIDLYSLDDVVLKLEIERLDFIKLDIDGHEPFFFRGASRFFKKCKPIMVLEFAQIVLDPAGEDVRTLKATVEDLGYILYSETTEKPFKNRREFLLECGNFTHSANAWAIPIEMSKSELPLPEIMKLVQPNRPVQ
jgi:FkbM family methyltransferase